MLLISALYLIDHKKEALGVKLLFNFWYYKMEALETIFFTSFLSQELIFITYKNV